LASEQKTPLSEAAPAAPKRSTKTATRSKVVRRRAIGGGAVALLLVGGGAFLLSRGPDGIGINLPFVNDRETPKFAFDKTKFVVTATTQTKPKDLEHAAQPAADDIEKVLGDFVHEVYIDPEMWGNYDDAFSAAMTKDAAEEAAKKADVVTLGATANDTYDFVDPVGGSLRMVILTDGSDAPVQASATLTFHATADLKDDTSSAIAVHGVYLLKLVDSEWRIFAFDVGRRERAVEASPSASASPSAEASA